MYSVRKTIPIIFGILILTSLSGFQFAPVIVQTAEAEPSKRIVGYFPHWESGDLDSIDYLQVTDIIYFHIWPNTDGTLDTSAVNLTDLQTIRNNIHAVGGNVLIAVGGWGVSDGFPAMVADPIARANFVSNISNYISTNNLDGVDIDWETQIDSTKIDNQDILLSDLAETLHPLGKLVTVAANAEVIELKGSADNSVNWVNLMAYDMNWGNAEHSTFADSIEALQRYENEGISKEKLSLGIPFYGRDDNTNAIKYQDVISSCNPLPSENYCNGYFFNGIDLVQQKTQYVVDNGYDGIMIWNLGQDTYDSTSLLNAINDVLDTPPVSQVIAVNDSYSTDENITLNVVANGILGNDLDSEGDPITAILENTVVNGSLTLYPDGSFTYTPNTDFNGVDSFTYHATDGTINSNTATVTITVNPIIDVYVEEFVVNTSGNKRWTGYVTTVVYSGGSPVEDANVLGSWSGGASGTASCTTNVNGQCQVLKATKNDILTFTVDDITGNEIGYAPIVSDSITFDKNGNTPGANSPPEAGNDSANVLKGSSVTINVVSNDSDDGILDLSTISITQVPSNDISLVDNGDGTLTYTHDGTDSVSDSFKYTINDNEGATSNEATVSISINEPPQDTLVHLSDIEGALTTKGPWNTFTITIKVHNATHSAQSEVIVSGAWLGISGTNSCTTDSYGSCSVSARDKNIGDVSFIVTGMSGSGVEYNSASNDVDPEILVTAP
ncbi:MAG: glycosyl hydrolase family 18 protein [Nitrosopumilus sp.]|nr:glycosyl hydrolase family 18 protein [Nitrosopumilus sp.]